MTAHRQTLESPDALSGQSLSVQRTVRALIDLFKNPTPPESASSNCSPFVVPPFSPPPPPAITYVWWSWHPCYPYWSESCWSAATIEEAQRYLTDPRTSLTVYHNKLIRHDGITLVEVQDVPCREMDVWHKIKRQMDANEKVSHSAGLVIETLDAATGYREGTNVQAQRQPPETGLADINKL